jgi:predicted permease
MEREMASLSSFASETQLFRAARRLLRSRSFAVLAISTLAFGIGINAAMLSIMDGLLFRQPFHLNEPERVVRVHFRVGDGSSVVESTHHQNFVDLKASGGFAEVAAYTAQSVSIGAGRDARLAEALLVSSGFFELLRLTPHLGMLSPGVSQAADRGDWVVISHGFWRRHFTGDPRAIGATLVLDGRVYSIIGVAPSGFQAPSSRAVDLWMPLDHASVTGSAPRGWQENRRTFWLSVIARLASETPPVVAAQRGTELLRNRSIALGDKRPQTVAIASLVPGRDATRSRDGTVSIWLGGVSLMVLLIACANVANLVLMRSVATRRDAFIRSSLGASRSALVRESLWDTCAMGITGTLGALVVSWFLRNALAVYFPGNLPLARELVDPRTTLILVISATLAFGLIGAASLWQLQSVVADPAAARGASDSWRLSRGPRRLLLAVQAGVSLALVFVAGLFATSLHRVTSLDLGVEADRTLQLTFNLAATGRDASEGRAIYERLRDRFDQHPAVERVSLADGSPYMSGSGAAPWTEHRSKADLWGQGEVAYRSVVGAGFFTTAGTSSLRGRDFVDADRAGESVAIINAPLARHLWPSAEALGQCMWLDKAPTCHRIVGVIGGVWKFSALKRDRMAVYLPMAQVPSAIPSALFIRPRGEPEAFLTEARAIAQSVHPDLPAVRAIVVRDLVDPEFRPWRLGATVFAAFALVAVVLASIGVYGVVALSCTLRSKEIGIRRALGARPMEVLRAVAGGDMQAVAGGVIVGAALALATSRWLASVLFETSPADPVILIGAALVLLIISTIAVIVPTSRALSASPAKALRSE